VRGLWHSEGFGQAPLWLLGSNHGLRRVEGQGDWLKLGICLGGLVPPFSGGAVLSGGLLHSEGCGRATPPTGLPVNRLRQPAGSPARGGEEGYAVRPVEMKGRVPVQAVSRVRLLRARWVANPFEGGARRTFVPAVGCAGRGSEFTRVGRGAPPASRIVGLTSASSRRPEPGSHLYRFGFREWPNALDG